MKEKGAVNYWPGFVDVLSNIVLVLIFVILILVLLMSKYINIAVKEASDRAVAQQLAIKEKDRANEASRLLEEERSRIASMVNIPENSQINKVGKRLTIVSGAPLKGYESYKDSKARLINQVNVLSIEFEGSGLTMDEQTLKTLNQNLESMGEVLKLSNLEISANIPGMFLSEKQRTAYFRAMAVRNILLEKGVKASQISVHVSDSGSDSEKAYVNVTVNPPSGRK